MGKGPSQLGKHFLMDTGSPQQSAVLSLCVYPLKKAREYLIVCWRSLRPCRIYKAKKHLLMQQTLAKCLCVVSTYIRY